MTDVQYFDVTIIGGGLAGLALSIQLTNKGFSVALFEKETYPFHKVCGEYISLESWDFMQQLGLPLQAMDLPIIKKLLVSSPDGNSLQHQLPLGGFGISRYKLDDMLQQIAREKGVQVFEGCKAEDIVFDDEKFLVTTSKGRFISRVCAGSFGKRSNLDVKWKRSFVVGKKDKLNNYIGVKYHIKTNFENDTIALHNFKDGYCGISRIEDEKYCLCYLTNAANLKENNNSVEKMEQEILYKNPLLKTIFENCEVLFKQPVTISQISFKKKSQVYGHVLLMGDAAGMITPLCGNGMSMALHSSKLAAVAISGFLTNKTTRLQMEKTYAQNWNTQFGKRLFAGRQIQRLFGKPAVTNVFIKVMKKAPAMVQWLIRQTHGRPF